MSAKTDISWWCCVLPQIWCSFIDSFELTMQNVCCWMLMRYQLKYELIVICKSTKQHHICGETQTYQLMSVLADTAILWAREENWGNTIRKISCRNLWLHCLHGGWWIIEHRHNWINSQWIEKYSTKTTRPKIDTYTKLPIRNMASSQLRSKCRNLTVATNWI